MKSAPQIVAQLLEAGLGDLDNPEKMIARVINTKFNTGDIVAVDRKSIEIVAEATRLERSPWVLYSTCNPFGLHTSYLNENRLTLATPAQVKFFWKYARGCDYPLRYARG